MKKTSLGLKKPEGTDLVNIQDMNDNMDVIEKELKVRVKTTGDIKDTTVTFTQESTRANIATGEKMSAIMGKIKKFFADLTAPAFAQMITTKADLMATKATGYVPDAKAVADAVSEVNGKLTKQLWKGSFTSGTIAVPGINKYICIAVNVGGVVCVGNRNYGIGGYVKYGDYPIAIHGYRFTVNTNDTIVIDKYNLGGSDGTKNVEITEIYGIY